MIDIPALYLDWNRGPLWVRLGNQTIAWGEAYFFRVMDVANGLDLRRHLALGPGAEEYQDQRVASPGIRVSYTFKNGWELDAFAQNARWDQVQHSFLASNDESMASVVAALEAHHSPGVIGKPIDDLAFALIAPLGTYNYYVLRHTGKSLPQEQEKRTMIMRRLADSSRLYGS